jgi:hypothetical protein
VTAAGRGHTVCIGPRRHRRLGAELQGKHARSTRAWPWRCAGVVVGVCLWVGSGGGSGRCLYICRSLEWGGPTSVRSHTRSSSSDHTMETVLLSNNY